MTSIRLTSTDQESLFSLASESEPGTLIELPLTPDDSEDDARTRLVLAGFIQIKLSSPTLLTACLPLYKTDTTISLIGDSASKASQQWATALAMESASVALVDEDDLIQHDGIENTPVGCVPDSKAKRKPCKNCSCGLANLLPEDEEASTKGSLQPPDGNSGCGSCGLGDAFRCASCPHLGLPPFKPGEKISVSMSLVTSDI